MGAMIFTVENLLLLVVLIIATITDIRSQRIPNWLTFPAIISGLGINFISGGAGGLLFSMMGLLIGIGIFIVLYIMGGMGAGDIKLMGAVGAMLGPQMVLMAALYTAIAGAIYALAIILLHPRAKAKRTAIADSIKGFVYLRKFHYNKPAETQNAPNLCYGVAIAIGTVTAVLLTAA